MSGVTEKNRIRTNRLYLYLLFMHTRKMKLAFVCHSIGHLSEVWMWRQITGFQKFKPHVFTWEYVNSEQFSLNGTQLNIIPFRARPEQMRGRARWIYRLKCVPYMNFYASVGAERQFIRKLLSETKPDVMLCQFGHAALRLISIAEQMKIPIAAHFHGLDLSSSLNSRWYMWSLLPALKKFNVIIVVGSHQKKWLIEQGVPKSKVHIIPCGVPTDVFEYKTRDPSTITQFICVSRLTEGKGVEYSIRAFNEVFEKNQNVRMVIIGNGPLKSNLKSLSENLGLEKHITFAGALFPDQVRNYLCESDVFLQHSITGSDGWEEGFGVSITEAAATGLPVIATRCGGISDQVIDGTTGYLVEQRDFHAMAKFMLKLAAEPALKKEMGLAGRENAVANFDTKKQISKLEAVLMECSTN